MTSTARGFAWRSSLVALTLLGNGCGFWDEPSGTNTQANHGGPHDSTGAECTKDPEEIRGVMLSPPECDTATPCPCGTICSDELGGHCTADCIDDTWCAPGHVCSGFGQCLGEDAVGTDPEVNPTCPRNETLLDQIVETPRSCGFDDECPFGSYCDRGERVCRFSCRDNEDCLDQGEDFVCTCLGKCAEPGDLRDKPDGELPTLELDTNAFHLSRPNDISSPDWGDTNSREVVLNLKSAIVSEDLHGPSPTIWVTPDENTLVSCANGAALSPEPCSVTLASDVYVPLAGGGGYESERIPITIAPSESAENVTLWEVRISSSGVRGGTQTVRAEYGDAEPGAGFQDIYPGYLGNDFRASGTALIETPTGGTLNVPVEARVLFDDTFGTVLALYDSSLTLSPSGTLPLGSWEDQVWLDSEADTDLRGAVRGRLAGFPYLTSIRLHDDGTVTGTADLNIVIPDPDTVFGGGYLAYEAYRPDTKLAFTLHPDPDGAPHTCDGNEDCEGGATCGVGFCGGAVQRMDYGMPVEIAHVARDLWTLNRDQNMTQANIESIAFITELSNPFYGGEFRASFFEAGRHDRTFGKSGDFDAAFLTGLISTPGGAQPIWDIGVLAAVPLLRADVSAPWMSSSGLLDACLTELARTPTQLSVPPSPRQDWLDDPNYYVTWPSCINLGRFFFGLRDRVIYQRLVQQWLEMHSFVAREGGEEFQLSKVAQLIDEPDAAKASSPEELMATVAHGLSLLLSELSTGGVDASSNAILAKLSTAELAAPDYREGSEDDIGRCDANSPCPAELRCENGLAGRTYCAPRSIDEVPQFEQPVGMAPFMLETAANYLKLAGIALDQTARSVYGTDGVQTTRRTALARYGRALRLAITIELLAKTYHERTLPCSGANCAAIQRRFDAAADEYQAALATAEGSARALRGGFDIYGIPEDEVALFFGDPAGTNSRYFASSDYLLNGYAEPAVQSARSALETARQAWLDQRNAQVQDQLNERNRQNEVDAIKSKFGSVILENCGQIEVPGEDRLLESTEVLDYFQTQPFDNNSCFVSPSCGLNVDPSLDPFTAALFDAFRDHDGEVEPLATRVAKSEVCKVASMQKFVPGGLLSFFAAPYARFSENVAALCPFNDIDSSTGWYCEAWLDDDGQFYFGQRTPANHRMPFAALYRPIRRDELGPGGRFRSITSGVLASGANITDGSDLNVYRFRNYRNHPLSKEAWNTATARCKDGRNGHAFLDSPLPVPSRELPAECFHGSMGTAYFELQGSYVTLQRARQVLANNDGKLSDLYRECAEKDAHREAILAQLETVQGLEHDLEHISSVVDIIGSAFSLNGGGVLDGLGSLLGISNRRDERRYLEELQTLFSLDESSTRCWNEWRSVLRELDTARSDIESGALAIKTRLVRFEQMAEENRIALQEGRSALERDAKRPIGSLAHHYWLDEKTERFKKEFEWARRLTLLSMKAIEYEFQQSLSGRAEIATAVHPDQLEDIVRELQAEQASRTINRRRPEESAIVVSVRDDVMGVMDRADAPAGERNWRPAQRFASRLWDERYAVRGQDGNWLGQGIPFTLGPTDVLETRCGERMWRVTATIQGDGLGVEAPNASVLLLKRNTFSSQFCDGKGEGMQAGAIRPSAELFKPGAEVDLADADQMTGAMLTPWFNVSRSEFYKESYREGASEELAGRGLYGDYVLLFPKQILDAGFALERVEDVLLRIDYLSVDNLEN